MVLVGDTRGDCASTAAVQPARLWQQLGLPCPPQEHARLCFRIPGSSALKVQLGGGTSDFTEANSWKNVTGIWDVVAGTDWIYPIEFVERGRVLTGRGRVGKFVVGEPIDGSAGSPCTFSGQRSGNTITFLQAFTNTDQRTDCTFTLGPDANSMGGIWKIRGGKNGTTTCTRRTRVTSKKQVVALKPNVGDAIKMLSPTEKLRDCTVVAGA